MSANPESVAENMVNIEINGVSLKAPRGSMIIEAADAAGIDIPRFCYHEKLPIAANCRMCLVEVEKVPKPLPACATPVNEGMKIFTRSPLALEAQRGVMEFLLINHPLDCPICDQGGECELQDMAMGYGRSVSRFTEKKRVVRDKNVGPLISTEMTRCIHCTRCIRTLQVVGGQKELGATGRGENTTIGTYIERSINSEMSGNVIDVCPVGALTSKPFRFKARAWELRQYDSIAPHDCVGSNIHVHTYQNRVMRVVPRQNENINEVWISDRDRFGYEGLNSEDRLTTPMIKTDGKWQETDWETALDALVQRLGAVIEARGGEQVGALVSPVATAEEMYLLQKLMRGIGCDNIDHRLRQLDFSDESRAPVFPWLGRDIRQLENLDAVLLVGSNVRKDQPIISHRLAKAVDDGTVAMAVNPVDYEFTFALAEKLIASPARMAVALAGIARALEETTGKSAPGPFRGLLDGVDVGETHRAMARHLSGAEDATVLLGSLAVLQPQYPILRSLAGLVAELTGAEVGYLPEAGNTAGAWLAGAVPHRGPGGTPVGRVGANAGEMLESPLGAYVLLGVEPEFDTSDARRTMAALEGADFVVALSSFRTPALERCADVMLPVTPFTETAGTFVNAEGRWQSFNGVVGPLGEARPGWKVLRVLGNKFEQDGFEFLSVQDVRDDLQKAIGGITPVNAVQLVLPDSVSTSDEGLQRIAEVPIYATDAIVRRASALQQTTDAADLTVHMNAATAEGLGVADSEKVLARQEGEWILLPLDVDERVPDDCVLIAMGVPGSEALGASFGSIEIDRG